MSPKEILPWASTILTMLQDPEIRDQDPVKKQKFIRTAKEGPITRLTASGISNGKIKKLAKAF